MLQEEWSLMFNFVSVYPDIVRQAVEDVHPDNSILSNLHTHKVYISTTGYICIIMIVYA